MPISTGEEVQCIVTVMGKCLNAQGLPSLELRDRVSVAARVMEERHADLMIPTGGDPAKVGVTEARVMADMLEQELGLDADKIVLEEEAKTTLENAINVLQMVKEMVRSDQKLTVVVVTSAYHLPFTSWCFRQVASALGLEITLEAEAATGEGALDMELIERRMTGLKNAPKRMKSILMKEGIVEPDFLDDLIIEDTCETQKEMKKLLELSQNEIRT